MFAVTICRTMSRKTVGRALQRTTAIRQHMMSTTAAPEEPTVLFESNGSLRTYTLNRPSKLNALDDSMLSLLRPQIQDWNASDLCGVIVGRGKGRAFCAGGDVASVVKNAAQPETRSKSIDYFKREFEMDYILAALKKPYIAVLDGFTMGGGVGLAANAPFRIATENTVFAMPETKIGYCPDVGGSYFLSRLDGEIGTYLALTSDTLSGRAVFEHGFATHYIASRRIPALLERLAELQAPSLRVIDKVIEEFSAEREESEVPGPFTGAKRIALDTAFRHSQVENILLDLEKFSESQDGSVQMWATSTLDTLHQRSPTSLKVALRAVRRGRRLNLLEALQMEFKIATAFCNGASPDFITGVTAVLLERIKERPNWSPSSVQDVTKDLVDRFFEPASPYLASAAELAFPAELTSGTLANPFKFTLPSEEEIGQVVMGLHTSGGGMGMRYDELVARFAALRPGKIGVLNKLREVVQRRCELTDNADGNMVWLKWKHSGR